MRSAVEVDIWSDVACPWCFLGKRRFETAAAAFLEAGGSLEVRYRSFQLAPDTPVNFDGSVVDFMVERKGMDASKAHSMFEQMTDLARTEGLAYDFESLQHTNTLKTHELLHFARERGRQIDMAERLFSAYLEEGRHVGRIDDLGDLAAEIGLERVAVVESLKAGAYAEAVKADKAQATAYGITGVPFFVFNGRTGVSGAQLSPVFIDAMNSAAHAGSRGL